MLDRRPSLAHVGRDVKTKPGQGPGSRRLDAVWQPHPLEKLPACQRAVNARRWLARRSLGRATGARRMTHALKALAEKYGVADADLAALPDAPRRHDATMKSLRSHATRKRPDLIQRRRRWAASGFLPPALAARFTVGELAALSVIAQEHIRSGRCGLSFGVVAARAGTGRTTVQNAVRIARSFGLLTSQERRISRSRNLPNLVRIVSKEWTAWLARRARSVRERAGSGSCQTGIKSSAEPVTEAERHPPFKSLNPLITQDKREEGFRDERAGRGRAA
jgi:hypothetical protein